MEQASATTEAGQKRLDAAEGRMNRRLANDIEEVDADPERGIGAVGLDIGCGNPEQRFGEATPGAYVAAARPVHPVRGERQAAEKSQGP